MESTRLIAQISQTGKRLPQVVIAKIITVLLVVYSAYLVALTVWQFFATPVSHGVIKPQSLVASSSSNESRQIDVGDLLSLSLFGEQSIQTKAPEQQEKTSVAPKTRLNLTLTGIVADNTSKVSEASVAIIESRNTQNTYGVGDKIEGTSAEVDQILLDRVILSVGPAFETLMLEGIEYSTTIPGAADQLNDNIDVDAIKSKFDDPARYKKPTANQRNYKVQAGPSRGNAKQLDKTDDKGLSNELREQREQLFDDPKQLLDYINISPKREAGQLIGYRLRPGKDPSLFERAGLKHNDLAININGYDLTDMQQALSLMRELRQLTEANITVLRDGSPVQIILAL